MGYTLKPRNKNIYEFDLNVFLWPVILQETGMCYILGYGSSLRPDQYVYSDGNSGSPVSNDGYRVTASEARAMAKLARGYISVKKFVNSEWDKLTDEEKERMQKLDTEKNIYTYPTGEKFLNKINEFAEFAQASGGFKIT